MQKQITEWRRYLAMWIAWVSLESADTTVATDELSIKVAVELAVAVLVLACETTEVAERRALARWLGLVANQGSRALTHIHTQSREHWPLPSSSTTVTDQGGGEITVFSWNQGGNGSVGSVTESFYITCFTVFEADLSECTRRLLIKR